MSGGGANYSFFLTLQKQKKLRFGSEKGYVVSTGVTDTAKKKYKTSCTEVFFEIHSRFS